MCRSEIIGTWREENSGLIQCPLISSTLFAVLLDPDSDDVLEPLYDKAGKYTADIQAFMAGFTPEEYPSNNLMAYFSLPGLSAVEASIRQKVRSAVPSVYADGDQLYTVLKLEMTADLTNGELELFEAQIEKQYEKGWGGALEEASIATVCGDKIVLCLWHSDIEFYEAGVFQSAGRKQNDEAEHS